MKPIKVLATAAAVLMAAATAVAPPAQAFLHLRRQIGPAGKSVFAGDHDLRIAE